MDQIESGFVLWYNSLQVELIPLFHVKQCFLLCAAQGGRQSGQMLRAVFYVKHSRAAENGRECFT